MPQLKGSWRYDAAAKQIVIELAQVQSGPAYRLPLEVGVANGNGPARVERIELTQPAGRFTIAADREPQSVTLDPNTWTLMAGPVFSKHP